MNLPKILVADIDGTLCSGGAMEDLTKKVLFNLHNKGIIIGVASGRAIFQIKNIVKNWNLDFDIDFYIGLNGVELYDCHNKQTYSFYLLKKEFIKEVYELVSPYAKNVYLYKGEGEITKELEDYMKDQVARGFIQARQVQNPSEFWEIDNAKIMFRFETPDDLNCLESTLKPNSNYRFFKTQSTLLEFCDPRVDKAVALKKYCELYQIELQEVLACGDNSNDNGMLKEAGDSVCLLGGAKDTIASAKHLTKKPCSEQGLAYYLIDTYQLDVSND